MILYIIIYTQFILSCWLFAKIRKDQDKIQKQVDKLRQDLTAINSGFIGLSNNIPDMIEQLNKVKL